MVCAGTAEPSVSAGSWVILEQHGPAETVGIVSFRKRHQRGEKLERPKKRSIEGHKQSPIQALAWGMDQYESMHFKRGATGLSEICEPTKNYFWVSGHSTANQGFNGHAGGVKEDL